MNALLLAACAVSLIFAAPLRPLTPAAQPHPKPKPKPKPKTRVVAYGAKADSLDGIPGHHFGEPRSSFPELEQRGFADPGGYVSYSLLPGKEGGWFGKNSEQVRTTYWFYQDKFAALTALTSGTVSQRQLLADESVYLFGKGLFRGVAFGEATTRWEGKKVLVVYLDGHNEARLSVTSQITQAQMVADKLAKQKAAAAARAAKFRADNAPAGH
jgi:hypothetical protein